MAGMLCKKSLPVSRFIRFSRIDRHATGSKYVTRGDPMRTEEEVKAIFEEWVIKNRKSYKSLIEKEYRFQIFRDHLRSINLHNSTGDPSSEIGLFRFADMTEREFKAKCCGGVVTHPPTSPTTTLQ